MPDSTSSWSRASCWSSGPNGAGKTNLLESLHVGTQGFSPRTRADAQLIRFGDAAARIVLGGERTVGVPLELEVTLRAGQGKVGKLNGATLRAAEQLRSEVSTLVFTPDRLAVVKGGPAVRRAYVDRALGRLAPARAALAARYAAAVAQRNAALRRASLGLSSREAIAPWTEQVASLGAELVRGSARRAGHARARLRRHADALGLPEASLSYEGEAADARGAGRAARPRPRPRHDRARPAPGRRADPRRHPRPAAVRLAGRAAARRPLVSPRRGGSDPRAERDAAAPPPRRRSLGARSRPPAHACRARGSAGQAVITATTTDAMPVDPDQVVDVSPGEGRCPELGAGAQSGSEPRWTPRSGRTGPSSRRRG